MGLEGDERFDWFVDRATTLEYHRVTGSSDQEAGPGSGRNSSGYSASFVSARQPIPIATRSRGNRRRPRSGDARTVMPVKMFSARVPSAAKLPGSCSNACAS